MRVIQAVIFCVVASAAHAQAMSFLVAQWFEGGNQMCKYDNGTVLNMGAKVCPLSIRR